MGIHESDSAGRWGRDEGTGSLTTIEPSFDRWPLVVVVVVALTAALVLAWTIAIIGIGDWMPDRDIDERSRKLCMSRIEQNWAVGGGRRAEKG